MLELKLETVKKLKTLKLVYIKEQHLFQSIRLY